VLRPINISDRPFGLLPVDPTAQFEAGQIGGLTQIGNDVFATVADGVTIQPFGIIDDTKTEAFSQPVIDEVVHIPSVTTIDGYGTLISSMDVMGMLKETDIVESSFEANMDLILDSKHGVITVPAGSQINYEFPDGTPGFEVVASYTFKIADFPGEDTTAGSQLMTLHFARGIFSTDQYDTTAQYVVNDNLFCGIDGKFTTKENGVVVGMVITPPSSLIGTVMFLWL